MFAKPIKEIEALRAKSNQTASQDLVAEQPVTLPSDSDLLDVRLTLEIGTAESIELKLPGRTITYDAKSKTLQGAPL